jgi:hypothetical protein
MLRDALFRTGQLVGVALLVCLPGCSEGNPLGREAIFGKVTLQGQPLDQGQIQFEPEATTGGIFNGAQIDAGAYSLDSADGLPPGKYRVRISSSEGGAEVNAEEAPGESNVAVAKERIPAAFNSASTQTVEVKEGDDNEFNFEIP